MQESLRNPKLIFEEKKAITLFLWLFYIFIIAYELLYFLQFPNSINGIIENPKIGLGYIYYILLLGILPIAIYLIKKGNPYIVKYLYIYSFIILDSFHVLLSYYGTDKPFASGHIVEVLFILFSPIFVNKLYFWTVSLGTIVKYCLFGLVLQDSLVLIPLFLYIVFSSIAFVILIRVYSYINSLTIIHEELRKKDRLAIIGQMAAAIGHEIRNPLSSLKGFTQLQRERHPNTNDFYPIMIQEIDRIDSIVHDLMTLGKPKEIKFSKANIEEIIAYTLSITQQQAERQGVSVETLMAGPLPPIECDSKQLKQVFINLIKNAIESMHDGGNVRIKIRVIEGRKMLISVEDEGGGIADENILNIGEPFFTTKQNGTGLGLMVTSQIIKDHNGNLNIESSLGKGTRVDIILPIIQKNEK